MEEQEETQPRGGEGGREEQSWTELSKWKLRAFTVMKNKDDVQMVPVGGVITKGMNSTAAFLNQEDQNLAFKKMIAVIQAILVKACKLGRRTEKEGAGLEQL